MAYPVTVDALIGSIRRRAFLPQDGDGSDTVSLLGLMNEAVGWLQGKIEGERQGHYRSSIDIPLVSGQQDYPVPVRSAGQQGEIVVPIDIQGNPIDQMLVRDDIEWAAMYPPSQTASYPWRYTWMANAIRVYPPPSGGGYSLRFFYLQRIAQLVLQSACWKAFGPGGGAFINVTPIFGGVTPPTGDYRPNAVVNGGPYIPGQLFDVVRGTPPFNVIYQDCPIVSVLQSVPQLGISGGTGFAQGTLVFNAVGGITAVPVAAGGTGYTQGVAVTANPAQNGTGSGFTAFANVSGGVITSITVTNPGTGYPDGSQGAQAFQLTGPAGDLQLAKVQVGDYICLADQAPVLTWTMLEAAPIFSQYCAMKLLEARKDPSAYNLAKDALGIETAVFQNFMAPRMRQQHNKVITGLGQFRWGARRTRPLGGYLR